MAPAEKVGPTGFEPVIDLAASAESDVVCIECEKYCAANTLQMWAPFVA
jgi:hypothetical protein